jgi:hypothetical protein
MQINKKKTDESYTLGFYDCLEKNKNKNSLSIEKCHLEQQQIISSKLLIEMNMNFVFFLIKE